jgi:FkbM family methyltransferase
MEKLKDFAHFLLSTAGFRFHTYNLRGLFHFLKRNKIEIQNVLDIGAHNGSWSEKVRKYIPMASFILIEPNSQHNERISSRGFHYFNEVLAEKDGNYLFYGSGQTGDSIFPELDSEGKTLPARSISALTLNRFFQINSSIPLPDFLKIDTQGSEIGILKGGNEIFPRTKVILLEIPVMPYNIGAPRFDDYIEFMVRNNFIPFYCSEIHEIRECLVQIDVAFMNKDLFEGIFGKMDSRGFWRVALKEYNLANS